MHLKHSALTLLATIGLMTLCGRAQAGVLAGQPAVFGPGTPQGIPSGDTVIVNNDNVVANNPNRITLVGINITGLDPIDISIPVANSPGASGTTEYFIELGSAANMTAVDWNGFVIELGSNIASEFTRLSELAIPGVSGLDFDTPDRDSVVSSPSFPNGTHDADVLTFSGGIVPVGEVATGQNFSIDIPDITNTASSTYDFTIRLRPLVRGGDFDNDGDVDGADFLIWQREPSVGRLTDWQANFADVEGDFDRDNDVDGADFLAWQRDLSVGRLTDWQTNFGQGISLASSSVSSALVPEPTGMPLLAVAVLICLASRNGRL